MTGSRWRSDDRLRDEDRRRPVGAVLGQRR